MFKSMTAFGRSKMTFVEGNGSKEISVEIRSVNSKTLDLSVRVLHSPIAFGYIEELVRPRLVAAGVSRGKIDVSVDIRYVGSKGVGVSLDSVRAASYVAALRRLSDEFGLKDDITVMSVAQNRDIFIADDGESEEEQKRTLEYTATVLDAAIEAYNAQRIREGKALMDDLRIKLGTVSGYIDEIEAISGNDIKSYRGRLEERLRRVLDEYGVKADEQRILTECAIFADKVSVDEETVRMRTHIKALYGFMDDDAPVGRRFDFQLQELNREINTTGSKCSNTDIAGRVVAVKAEIEKIREQIQNVE